MTSANNTPQFAPIQASHPRHHGYDNCKMVFMLLVVLWHSAQLYILEATLSSNNSAGDTGSELSIPWWERANNHQLHHHSSWSPLISHLVTRYWLWTEKIAVPGFCFLSGYFSKGFLPTSHSKQDDAMDPTKQLLSLQRSQRKERVRWEKTISTLLLGPLLWQVLTWLLGQVTTGFYTGGWSLGVSSKMDLWDNLGSWYLFALLMWRIWTSLFLSRLRQDRHIPLLVSMILALLSTHTNRGGPQDMRMRLFFFFPFYVAGLYCNEETWNELILFPCRLCKLEPNRITSSLDHLARFWGCIGIGVNVIVCQLVPRDDLGWQYSIDTYQWRPHLVFFSQYLLAGSAIISVIMVVKTIQSPLFPFGHGNSTLAIYEGHWPVANWLAWGNLPFTDISATNTSWVQHGFSQLPPIPAVLGVHVVCYLICVGLGSRLVWNRALHHVCDPQWACRWLFHHDEIFVERPPSSSKASACPIYLV